MNSPIKIKNETLTGAWQEIRINPEYIAVAIQARGANALQVARPGESSVYYTIKAGTVLDLSSGNFTNDDYIAVKGTAADVCEIIGFVRS